MDIEYLYVGHFSHKTLFPMYLFYFTHFQYVLDIIYIFNSHSN